MVEDEEIRSRAHQTLPSVEQKPVEKLIADLRIEVQNWKKLYYQERAERMRLQEDIHRLEEKDEQLMAALQGLTRGRWEMSKVINMRLLEMAEACGGIINAWKLAKRGRQVPYNLIIMLIGFISLLIFLGWVFYTNPVALQGIGMWTEENKTFVLIFTGLVVLALIYYFRSRKSVPGGRAP
ncbi:MAG: hypothetical protein QXP04_00325 [Candidatus Nanoarchaeia archaeon]|nr:hypothetical protein [Candidatus Jingweiarchaeum tengchongense]